MSETTVIDACKSFNFDISYGNKILITLHRRENFGNIMEIMFNTNGLLLNAIFFGHIF